MRRADEMANGVLTPGRVRLGGDAFLLVVRNEVTLYEVGVSPET